MSIVMLIVVIVMSEYIVMYAVKLSAKSDKDLGRKAEQVGESLSKHLHKSVVPHGYVNINDLGHRKW